MRGLGFVLAALVLAAPGVPAAAPMPDRIELLRLKQHSLAVLEQHLAHPDPFVRASAAKALGDLAGPEALPHLRRALTDGYVDVRLFAVEALGGLHQPASEIGRAHV